MYNISDYLRSNLLDHILGVAPYTPPSSVWIGLLSELSDNGDVITEISNSGYVRKQLLSSDVSVPTIGEATNLSNITWDAAISEWGPITYIGLFDSQTNGNLLWWGQMRVAKYVSIGAIFKIVSGNLVISAGGAFSLYSRNGIIQLVLRNNVAVFPMPGSVWAGVGSIVGSYSTSISEPSGSSDGYDRIEVLTYTSIDSGIKSIHTPEIDFAADGGDWGAISCVGLWDSGSGGNLLFALPMSLPRTVYDGDGLTFAADSITIRVE